MTELYEDNENLVFSTLRNEAYSGVNAEAIKQWELMLTKAYENDTIHIFVKLSRLYTHSCSNGHVPFKNYESLLAFGQSLFYHEGNFALYKKLKTEQQSFLRSNIASIAAENLKVFMELVLSCSNPPLTDFIQCWDGIYETFIEEVMSLYSSNAPSKRFVLKLWEYCPPDVSLDVTLGLLMIRETHGETQTVDLMQKCLDDQKYLNLDGLVSLTEQWSEIRDCPLAWSEHLLGITDSIIPNREL